MNLRPVVVSQAAVLRGVIAGFIGAAGFLSLGLVKPVPHTHNAAWEAATKQQLNAWPKESGGTVAINPTTTNPEMK